jgi:hypothetical protein
VGIRQQDDELGPSFRTLGPSFQTLRGIKSLRTIRVIKPLWSYPQLSSSQLERVESPSNPHQASGLQTSKLQKTMSLQHMDHWTEQKLTTSTKKLTQILVG